MSLSYLRLSKRCNTLFLGENVWVHKEYWITTMRLLNVHITTHALANFNGEKTTYDPKLNNKVITLPGNVLILPQSQQPWNILYTTWLHFIVKIEWKIKSARPHDKMKTTLQHTVEMQQTTSHLNVQFSNISFKCKTGIMYHILHGAVTTWKGRIALYWPHVAGIHQLLLDSARK